MTWQVPVLWGVFVLVFMIDMRLHGQAGRSNAYIGKRVPRSDLAAPPTLWKLANLAPTLSGDVGFVGLGHKVLYSADEDSWCVRRRPHAFKASCTCGFYAYPERALAESHLQRGPASVLLSVAPSGEYVEAERGWRFSHQRVTGVHVGQCGRCDLRPAAALFKTSVSPVWIPGCTFCTAWAGTRPGTRTLTFEELASSLNAQVTTRNAPPVAVVGESHALTRPGLDSLVQPRRSSPSEAPARTASDEPEAPREA